MPLVVRLQGNNVEGAMELMKNSDIKCVLLALVAAGSGAWETGPELKEEVSGCERASVAREFRREDPASPALSACWGRLALIGRLLTQGY